MNDLGREVLGALKRGDLDALESFRLTESEHNEVVWPELPAADAGYPVDLAWQSIQLRNQRAAPRAAGALRRVFERSGELEFETVECEGETETFKTFVVHTECYVRFRAGGAAYRVRLFKDVLVRNGGYKVFRYYGEGVEAVGAEDRTGGG